MRKFLTFGILVLIISSCATHSGIITNSQVPNSSEGIIFKDRVYGYASCHYVFYIGGMRSQGLALEATNRLKRSVILRGGEYLDNFTIDHKRFYFTPFFIRHEVIVSADKIQSMEDVKVRYHEDYLNHLHSIADETNASPSSLRVNEKVLVETIGERPFIFDAVVLETGIKYSKVLSGNNGQMDVLNVKNLRIFSSSSENRIGLLLGVEEGDSIAFNDGDFSSGSFEYANALFRGSNHLRVLLQTQNNGVPSGTKSIEIERIIVNNSSAEDIDKLNKSMLQILKYTQANQDVVGWTDANQIFSGQLSGFTDENASIKLENQITKDIELHQLYTTINWLIFFGDSSGKVGLELGDRVLFIDERSNSKPVEIVGFRYYRVLVKTLDGEYLDVPIGRLVK